MVRGLGYCTNHMGSLLDSLMDRFSGPFFSCVCVTLTVCRRGLLFVHISTYVRIAVIEVAVPFPAVLATDVGIPG